MDILVSVVNQTLYVPKNLCKYVEGSQNFVRFYFILTDNWDGLKTFAQFTQKGQAYNVYLDENNSVYLPPEIVAGTCTLMLYGSYDTVTATTNYLTLELDENILVSDANSTEISESLYNQLVTRVENNAANIKNNAEISESLYNQLVARVENNATNINSNAGNIQSLAGLSKSEIASLSARMDAFTALSEGSTTGDAELVDARIDIEGNTWSNVGGHIRGITKEFRGNVRPYAWTVKAADSEKGWNTFLNLPTNYFYRLSADLPASFGLPVAGSAGTLVVFDASNYDAGSEWFVLYVCTQLVGAEEQIHICYTRPAKGLEAVQWKRLRDVSALESQVAQLEDAVGEMEVLKKCIRPFEWNLNSGRTGEGKTWPTIIDLPANQFYRFVTDVPDSFGLPVSGVYGTLVVFDAGSDAQAWYKFYICTALVGGSFKTYFAYANTMDKLVWKEVALNAEEFAALSAVVGTLEERVEVLDACIRPYEWSLNSGRTGEGKTWPTIMDLPANQFYRFGTDVPQSFGLPVTGKNGTLVVFDAGSDAQAWYKFYVCAVLIGGSEYKTYFAYANKMGNLIWKEVVMDPEHIIEEVKKGLELNVTKGVNGLVLGVDRPKIVLLGDSITAGVGSSDYSATGDLVINKTYSGTAHVVHRNVGDKGWGQLFKAHMEAAYPGCEVVNNGWPGVTTWMLSDSLAELVPEDCDIAIVQVGTNSRTQTDKAAKIIQPVETIIDYLRGKGITPIIMTNTVLQNQTAPNDADNVRQCILKACENKGVYCFDVLGEMEWYLWQKGWEVSAVLADNLHPNDVGHELIYQIYRRLLRV